MTALRVLAAVLVLGGCGLDDDDDLRIISPSTPTTIDQNVVTGQVCRVIDLSNLATCTTIDVSNLTLSVGTTTVTTLADGTFAIAAPTQSVSVAVNGATVTPTLSPLVGSAFNPFVPVVDADVFARVLTSNNIFQAATNGSILAFVTRSGVPVRGVFATTIPASTVSPIFDGVGNNTFTVLGTGANGIILAPNLIPGGTQLVLTDATNSFQVVLDPIRVLEGGVTIVNAQL